MSTPDDGLTKLDDLIKGIHFAEDQTEQDATSSESGLGICTHTTFLFFTLET